MSEGAMCGADRDPAVAKAVEEGVETWLTRSEVARLAGVSARKVNAAVACGKLRAYVVNGKALASVLDVLDWLARTVPAASPKSGGRAEGAEEVGASDVRLWAQEALASPEARASVVESERFGEKVRFALLEDGVTVVAELAGTGYDLRNEAGRMADAINERRAWARNGRAARLLACPLATRVKAGEGGQVRYEVAERWLSKAKAAAMARVGVDTISQAIGDGELPAGSVNGRAKISSVDVAKWIRGHALARRSPDNPFPIRQPNNGCVFEHRMGMGYGPWACEPEYDGQAAVYETVDELLSQAEAASRVKVAPVVIRDAVRAGELASTAAGGRVKVRASDLSAWVVPGR